MDRGGFAGRHEQLVLLEADLAKVRSTRRGLFVLVRGRRQVGKSRRVEEFIGRGGAPSVFFTATKGREAAAELNEFTHLLHHPSIDGGRALADTMFRSWDAALSALARTVDEPTVVVVDEVPYLYAGAPDVEGEFQKAWDRSLKNSPVLLIVIGSDLAMMEALTEYGRPLYGRPSREIDLRPLSPHDVAALTRDYKCCNQRKCICEGGGSQTRMGAFVSPLVRACSTWSGYLFGDSRPCRSNPPEAGELRQTRVTVSKMCQ